MKDSKALAATPATDLAPAAAAGALAPTAAQARPIVNLHLTGSNNILNFGGLQQIGQNTCGGTDSQALAATIRAQAETIAAQQRTIDRLLSMLEKAAAAQLDTRRHTSTKRAKPTGAASS